MDRTVDPEWEKTDSTTLTPKESYLEATKGQELMVDSATQSHTSPGSLPFALYQSPHSSLLSRRAFPLQTLIIQPKSAAVPVSDLFF